jgi:hypothetical protein
MRSGNSSAPVGTVMSMDRAEVHQELLTAPGSYRTLTRADGPELLRRRTAGTRWTNREMLFHLLLGYLVVRALLPLVRLVSRTPSRVQRGFAATLNAGRAPFHLMNYLGSVIGGHLLSLYRMERVFSNVCNALARRLDRTPDAELARSIPLPRSWDPFFTDRMTILDVYHYPLLHFEFHRAQLTLDRP